MKKENTIENCKRYGRDVNKNDYYQRIPESERAGIRKDAIDQLQGMSERAESTEVKEALLFAKKTLLSNKAATLSPQLLNYLDHAMRVLSEKKSSAKIESLRNQFSYVIEKLHSESKNNYHETLYKLYSDMNAFY